MSECMYCKGRLEWVVGDHKARWLDTVITVSNAKYRQCTVCERTTFTPEEGLRLQALAKQAYEQEVQGE